MKEFLEQPGGRFRDHLDPKVADWVIPYETWLNLGDGDTNETEGMSFDIAILGAPLSKTSISHSGAFRLPDSIRTAFQALTPYSIQYGLGLNEVLRAVDLGNVRMHVTDLMKNQQMIEEAVYTFWKSHTFAKAHSPRLVVLGGDHSITASSVVGYARSTSQRIGIIHFDAHLDVRNLEDGGRTNGTPFRTILSSGLVPGHRIVQIGLRDFANAKVYHQYVLEHGVTVVTAREVRRQGMMNVLERALEQVSHDADAVYVSFDMDVLDQSFVPGVPAPGPGGLTVWEAQDALEWLGAHPSVTMLDIVCADPTQDVRDLTTRVAANLVLSFSTGMALAKVPK